MIRHRPTLPPRRHIQPHVQRHLATADAADRRQPAPPRSTPPPSAALAEQASLQCPPRRPVRRPAPPQRRSVDRTTGRLYRIVNVARRVSPPPVALRRARLDNLALVPASLLPQKATWQAFANSLPVGSTLIVLPQKRGAARTVLEQVSSRLSAHGAPVTTVEQGKIRRDPRRREGPAT